MNSFLKAFLVLMKLFKGALVELMMSNKLLLLLGEKNSFCCMSR